MEDFLDLRIIKTRKSLIDALWELLRHNANIKVLELCKKAKITPMTFYHQFDNKTQFIEYAIKEQLENKFPIPKMLKPKTLKQLLIYLVHTMYDFYLNNKELFYQSINFAKKEGFEDSFIFLANKIFRFYIKTETNLLFASKNQIVSSIWGEFIANGLLGLFTKQIAQKHLIDKAFLVYVINELFCLNM